MREPTAKVVAEQVNSPAVPTIATPEMVATVLTTATVVMYTPLHAVSHVIEQMPEQPAAILSRKYLYGVVMVIMLPLDGMMLTGLKTIETAFEIALFPTASAGAIVSEVIMVI